MHNYYWHLQRFYTLQLLFILLLNMWSISYCLQSPYCQQFIWEMFRPWALWGTLLTLTSWTTWDTAILSWCQSGFSKSFHPLSIWSTPHRKCNTLLSCICHRNVLPTCDRLDHWIHITWSSASWVHKPNANKQMLFPSAGSILFIIRSSAQTTRYSCHFMTTYITPWTSHLMSCMKAHWKERKKHLTLFISRIWPTCNQLII